MTTNKSPIQELEVQNVNQADGKTYYKPVILKVGGTSQYRDTEFFFGNVEGYWDSSHAKGNGLIVNQWVKVALSTKEKPGGPNTKPGALYRDIVQVRPATDDEIPASVPDTPQNGNQSQDNYRRSVPEMRWTEALHMAVAAVGTIEEGFPEEVMRWAPWFYEELCKGPEMNGPSDLWPHRATESHGDDMPYDAPMPEHQDDLPF